MSKTNVTIISLLLGLAVVLGLAAAMRTTGLATQQASAGAGTLEARQQRLDRLQAELRRALASRPPALPAARPASRAVAPRVTYVRPTSVVVPQSPSGEDEEHEHEDSEDEGLYEGGADD